MSGHSQYDYTFPCVVIRSEEVNLLSGEDMERVMNQTTVQGVMNILSEFGYGDGKEPDNPRDYEKVLRTKLEEAYETVYSIIPDEKEMNLFSYPNDFHNAKVLLKAEFLKTNAEHLLLDTGIIPKEQMEEMIRKRNFEGMSVKMREAVKEAIDVFSKTRDPQEIDIILDKACYQDMLSDAEDSKNEFVINYIRLLIDILNVNAFVRLREIEKPKTFFRKICLTGGNLDGGFFEDAYEEAYQSLAEKLEPFGFRDVFLKGAEDARVYAKYTCFEKLLDDLKLSFVRDSLYIPFGIEPIVGYIVAKETEIKNLRIILAGLVAGTPKDEIRERLRETYV